MKVAYVVGPYRSEIGPYGIKQNIQRAEEVAIQLWRLGYAVICPHKNTAFFDGAAPDEVWLRGDIELIRRSDLVVTVKGWESSSGARGEVEFCRTHNIPFRILFLVFVVLILAEQSPLPPSILEVQSVYQIP